MWRGFLRKSREGLCISYQDVVQCRRGFSEVKGTLNIVTLCLYILLSSASLIGMRKFMGGSALRGLSLYLDPYVLMSLAGYGISFIIWTVVVSKNNLTFVYPLSVGCIFIIVYLGSVGLLHEPWSLRGIAAGVLILSGVVLLAW